MKALLALSVCAALSTAAHAQVRLPQLPGVQRLPGVLDRVLPQPLPEILSSTCLLYTSSWSRDRRP